MRPDLPDRLSERGIAQAGCVEQVGELGCRCSSSHRGRVHRGVRHPTKATADEPMLVVVVAAVSGTLVACDLLSR